MKLDNHIDVTAGIHVGGAIEALVLNALLKFDCPIASLKPKELHHTSINSVVLDIVNNLPEKPVKVTAFYSSSVLMLYEDFYIQVSESRNYVLDQSGVDLNGFLIGGAGNIAKITNYNPIINKLFSTKSFPRVEWWYATKEEGVLNKIIPLKDVPETPTEFYPWFEGDINTHIKDFVKDNASILMLFGPPGTGKTSLLRSFIKESNLTAIVSYEDVLLENDELFISFLNRKDDCVLLIEDADILISSRQDGNKLITRFLNMADGILSTSGKKIIFTSNLNNYANIDDALMRPGRCYDVIEFKPLTQEQANGVAKMIKKPSPKGKQEYTLAEVFNQNKNTTKVNSKLGFAA